MAVLSSDKVDFRANDIANDKKGHFIMESIHWEDITVLSIYVLSNSFKTHKISIAFHNKTGRKKDPCGKKCMN